MKNIYPDETYEERNVLSQYDRPASLRAAGYFLFSFIKRVSVERPFHRDLFT